VTGAVLNVKASMLEVIVGCPPTYIINRIHHVKHLLKVNFSHNQQEDRLANTIISIIDENMISPKLLIGLKDTFAFLKWKIENLDCGNGQERQIIQSRNFSEYFNLSHEFCLYNKSKIDTFTHTLWQQRITTQLQNDGLSFIPSVDTRSIPIPMCINREDEVVMLRFIYNIT